MINNKFSRRYKAAAIVAVFAVVAAGFFIGSRVSFAAQTITGTTINGTNINSVNFNFAGYPLGGLYGTYPTTNSNSRSFIYSINAAYANVAGHYGISYDQSNNSICIDGNGNCAVRLGMDNGIVAATSFSGSYSGTMNASNLSAGSFGSNTGGGNYSFPGNITLGYVGSSPAGGPSIQWTNGTYTSDLGLYVNAGLIFQGNSGNPDFKVFTPTTNGALGTEVVHLGGGSTSANSWFNGGNVGIGTTNPIRQLEVSNAVPIAKLAFTTQSHNTNDVLATLEFGNDSGTNGGGTQQVSSYISSVFTRSGCTGCTFEDAGLTFGTLGANDASPTERMRITDLGNVGIGNTTPAYKLDVTGDVRASGSVYVGTTGARLYSDASDRLTVPNDFYVTTAAGNTYLYSTNTYLGNTSGDNIYTRGNTISGNSWSITGAGAATFATVNTGQGANELYAMNQNVQTTNSPTFAGLTISGSTLTGSGSAGSYGSISIAGSKNGYSGIHFPATTNGDTFMVRNSDGLSGMYNQTTSAWHWYFSASGVLTVGTVPAGNVSAGTFGAGAYTFPSTLTVSGNSSFHGTSNVFPGTNSTTYDTYIPYGGNNYVYFRNPVVQIDHTLSVGGTVDFPGSGIWNSSGNVGIKTTSPSYTLQVNGSFAATYKNFVIPDPIDLQNKLLVHSSIEGPEHAVYYRGEAQLVNGKAKVEMPAYFEALTRKENRTVLLTDIDGFDQIAVKSQGGMEVKDGAFYVYSLNKHSSQKFSWEVMAVRADVPVLVPEVPQPAGYTPPSAASLKSVPD